MFCNWIHVLRLCSAPSALIVKWKWTVFFCSYLFLFYSCTCVFKCIFVNHYKLLKKYIQRLLCLCNCVCSSACSTYVHRLCLHQTRWVHADTLWQRCPVARIRQCRWTGKWHRSCLCHCHISYNRCLGQTVGCSGALNTHFRKDGRRQSCVKRKETGWQAFTFNIHSTK